MQDVENARLVDSHLLERQPDDELVVLGGIPFPVFLIAADCDIAVYRQPVVEHRAKPALERAVLELARAPARLRRREEIIVLLEPEIEVAVGVQPQYRLSEKPLQTPEIFVNLRQLLASVGKKYSI